MKLHAKMNSERGKTVTKSGNETINIDLTVNREHIGTIELYLFDEENPEWLLKYYKDEDSDPIILKQGHIE